MDEPMDVSMSEDLSPADVSMAEVFTPKKPEPKKSSINIVVNSNPQILNSTFENNNKFNDNNDFNQTNNPEICTSPIPFDQTDNSLSMTNDFKTPQASFNISNNLSRDTNAENSLKQNDFHCVENTDNRNSSNILYITTDTKDENHPCEVINANIEANTSPNHLIVGFKNGSGKPLNTAIKGSPEPLNTTFDGNSLMKGLHSTMDGNSTPKSFNNKSPNPTFESSNKVVDATFEGNTSANILNATFERNVQDNTNSTFESIFHTQSNLNISNQSNQALSPSNNSVNVSNSTSPRNEPPPSQNLNITTEKPKVESPLDTTFEKETLVTAAVQNKLDSTIQLDSLSDSTLQKRIDNEGKYLAPKIEAVLENTMDSNTQVEAVEKPQVESLLDSTFQKEIVVETSKLDTTSHLEVLVKPNVESLLDSTFEKKNAEEKFNTSNSINHLEIMEKPVVESLLDSTFQKEIIVETDKSDPISQVPTTTEEPKVESLIDATCQKEIVLNENLELNKNPKVESLLDSTFQKKICVDANKLESSSHLAAIENPKVESLLDSTFQKEICVDANKLESSSHLAAIENPKVESLLDSTFQKEIVVDANKLESMSHVETSGKPKVESLLDATFEKDIVDTEPMDSGKRNDLGRLQLQSKSNVSTTYNKQFIDFSENSSFNNTIKNSENVEECLDVSSGSQGRKSVLDADVTFSLLNITVATSNVNEDNVITEEVVESKFLDEIFDVKCEEDDIDSSDEDKLSKTIESIVEKADKAINESFNSSLIEESVKEDRIPLKNLHDNSLELCKEEKEVKVTEIITNNVKSCEDKENQQSDNFFGDSKALIDPKQYDFSIFSNSPTKVVKGPRNSILRLFDPLSQLSTSKSRESQEFTENTIVESKEDKESELVKSLKEALDVSDEHDHEEFVNQLPETIKTYKLKMDEALEQKMQSEQELNTLKLELNQLQQERTTLELELHQKDEIILKTQGEAQKRENQYKHEIKQLNDKLNNINEQNNNEEMKSLKEENAALLDRESQLREKLNKLLHTENSFQKIMLDYESTLSHKFTEFEKLKAEHDTAKKHLATLEMSFSDLHTKYERSKDIIAGYKNNEEALTRNLEGANQSAHKNEERYESLKAHAKAQIEKSNKELLAMKEKHTGEINKLSTIIRRLEIKNGSIQQALDQKIKECAALAALCDEMTGAVPH